MNLKKELIVICLILTGVCCKQTKDGQHINEPELSSMKKFDWLPTECAPRHYPITIHEGAFITEDNRYFMVPSGGIIRLGWGRHGSTYVVGPDFKDVPVKLKIIWLSYTEDQFYYGDFDLPKDKITELFEKGFIDDRGKKDNYDALTVGMAPGGAVSVWMMGASNYVEIGHYQAEKTEVEWKDFVPNSSWTREDYVADEQQRFSDETKQILERDGIPIGKWTGYRKTFKWKPVFRHPDGGVFIGLVNKFYNGEFYNIRADNPILKEYKNYPPSKKNSFSWYDKNKNRYTSEIDFDETEIWAAFEKIFEDPETERAELVMNIDKYNDEVKVTLESETDTVLLEKSKIKIYPSTDSIYD